MPSLRSYGDVGVLDLGDGRNVFSHDFIIDVHEHLSEAVERNDRALIITGSGNYFSAGLDVEWLNVNRDRAASYVQSVHTLLGRVLTLSMPTLAAINGRATGAGALLALAADLRVMDNHGRIGFTEADTKVPFTNAMAALIQAKVTPKAATWMMVMASQLNADRAIEYDVIDATAKAHDLIPFTAGFLAERKRKDPATMTAIKSVMYADVIAALKG
ncbi:enoyl-CoA hydratase/isomerase family protein [Nocardia camponoti]|uniref:Enoyl-CoA hydratase n=1 Tax=Nocardia camponoti TaxID=1616106 RepID=A0A917Q8Q4_9NOCA|nr:enoyl-CoA hydratase/isomerase family protein [Nocardia camponoti]GGK36472.1 enoyl-CoA hydratase [Nocardia camponoti]